jgi:diguanylate cyclase (GGDEF)-like protein
MGRETPQIDAVPKRPVGRYIIGLLLIAALAVASTAFTYSSLSRQETDATIVQVASSQGPLSRQLATLAEESLATVSPASLAAEMRSVRDQLEVAYRGLQTGDAGLGLPGDNPDAVDQLFLAVAGAAESLFASADTVISALENGTTPSRAAVETLTSSAALFDAAMGSVVFQYQVDAEQHVVDLKKTQYVLLSATLVLLLVEGLFIFRPAVRELKQRWGERSAEREFDPEQLSYLARYDPLTGLINRTLFTDRLVGAVARARRDGGLVALMFLDVDNFKEVNDGYGHSTGDILLRQIAERLTGSVRESDTVARLGGDEFTVILEGGHRVEDAGRVATKVLTALSAPYRIGDHEMHVTTSLGIAIYPVDGEDAEELLRGADIAMYSAKAAGKNTYQYFTRELRDKATERQNLIDDLRRALDEGDQLELVYQPAVDVAQGTVLGVEALLRWNHPHLGVVEPARFIPLAEETDLIIPVGEWVLFRACAQMETWRHRGMDNVAVSVNVSARQFRLGNLVETVAASLAATKLNPRYLSLELTEGTILSDVEMARRTLERLRDLGVRVSIDDFGTGYSSLRDLERIPIASLKIDRSFISRVTEDPGGAAIPSAVIGLAQSLRFGVIAEGVETAEQATLLYDLGCEMMQGYYVSRPLHAAEVLPFIRASQNDRPALEAG